jgi:uncharacterized membrane protein
MDISELDEDQQKVLSFDDRVHQRESFTSDSLIFMLYVHLNCHNVFLYVCVMFVCLFVLLLLFVDACRVQEQERETHCDEQGQIRRLLPFAVLLERRLIFYTVFSHTNNDEFVRFIDFIFSLLNLYCFLIGFLLSSIFCTNRRLLFVSWLIATNWTLAQSIELLENDVTWREKEKMDSLLSVWGAPDNEKRLFLEKFYPMGIVGVDKKGAPLYMERIGRFDQAMICRLFLCLGRSLCCCFLSLCCFDSFRSDCGRFCALHCGLQKGLFKCVTVEDYTKHHLYQIEQLEKMKLEATKKGADPYVRKHVVILDIEGVGWGTKNLFFFFHFVSRATSFRLFVCCAQIILAIKRQN